MKSVSFALLSTFLFLHSGTGHGLATTQEGDEIKEMKALSNGLRGTRSSNLKDAGEEWGDDRKLESNGLRLFGPNDTSDVKNYTQAIQFCEAKNLWLANREEICKEGEPFQGIKTGDQWSPIRDHVNGYVQVGETSTTGHRLCATHRENTSSFAKYYGEDPSWGVDNVKQPFESNFIYCRDTDGLYDDGTKCNDGRINILNTCKYCKNESTYWKSDLQYHCGPEKKWGDGTACIAEISPRVLHTCDQCENKATLWRDGLFRCGSEPKWSSGTVCFPGFCGNCVNDGAHRYYYAWDCPKTNEGTWIYPLGCLRCT